MKNHKKNKSRHEALQELYEQAVTEIERENGDDASCFDMIDAYLKALHEDDEIIEHDFLCAMDLLYTGIMACMSAELDNEAARGRGRKIVGGSDDEIRAKDTLRERSNYYVRTAIHCYHTALVYNWDVNFAPIKLVVAAASSAICEENFLRIKGDDVGYDHYDDQQILALIDNINPEDDDERFYLGFIYRTLHEYAIIQLNIQQSFDYAMKSLRCYLKMQNMDETALMAISSMFALLESNFRFDHELKILFGFAADAFSHNCDDGSLKTLAGIVWKYNTDFCALSPAKQQALLMVLDLIQSCVQCGKFTRDTDGEPLSYFPENNFCEEMRATPNDFQKIYEQALASHVSFNRLANQPQLTFDLYLQSKAQLSEMQNIATRVQRIEADHATMFKAKRGRKNDIVTAAEQPIEKKLRSGRKY